MERKIINFIFALMDMSGSDLDKLSIDYAESNWGKIDDILKHEDKDRMEYESNLYREDKELFKSVITFLIGMRGKYY